VIAIDAQTSEVIYPVTVGGQPRSSVTVVKKNDGYTPSSFGNAEVARQLTRIRGDRMGDTFAVHRSPRRRC